MIFVYKYMFMGSEMQWDNFQFLVFGGHLEIQDGRHVTFVFVYH